MARAEKLKEWRIVEGALLLMLLYTIYLIQLNIYRLLNTVM
jgi:hypothetical protein